jgi:hypothetical protein
MSLDNATSVRWTTPEQALSRIANRNKRLRIINESLFVKVKGSGDTIYVWDWGQKTFVYVRKHDWVRASPAIRTVEACVLLRMSPNSFRKRRDELGLLAKKTNVQKIPGVPKQGPQDYYTINDLIEISRVITRSPQSLVYDFASEQEIRHLFTEGYIPYKKTLNGDYIPIWSESIY